MTQVSWHKLSNKKKKYLATAQSAILLSSIFMSDSQFKNFIKINISDFDLLIIGAAKSNPEFVPGMEGSEQFRLMFTQEIKNKIAGMSETDPKLASELEKKMIVLEYKAEYAKYLIRELRPKKVFWVNGSWQHSLHFSAEWWEAYEIGVEIDTIAPFSGLQEAQDYAAKIQKLNEKWFNGKWHKLLSGTLNSLQLRDFCFDVAKFSWDWTGQTGACITERVDRSNIKKIHNKKNIDHEKYKVLAWSPNVVVPYEAYMMQNGALKEKRHTPPGENIELTQANHAEVAAILRATEIGIKLKGCEIWTSKFPCPVCARIIADSPLSKVFYCESYPNDVGKKILGGKVQKA